MRRVELDEGISLGVPGNFPKRAVLENDGVKRISFSMKPHEGAKRYASFFEIVLSDKESDIARILPEEGYAMGPLTQEELMIRGEKANLESGELVITRPCGSKETAALHVLRYYCPSKKKYLTIVTYSMARKGLLDIIKTVKYR